MGFPYAVHADPAPSQDPGSQKWIYHRAHEADAYVIPYQATCLALWKGHCNVQCVSNEAWSKYVLKYAMKADCAGDIDLEHASCLGLITPSLSPSFRAVAGAYSSLRFISPCEAACVLAQIPMVVMPPVRYTDTSPPFEAHSSRYPAHMTSLDTYMGRPPEMENLTFIQFHSSYTSKRSEATSPDVVGEACGAPSPLTSSLHVPIPLMCK